MRRDTKRRLASRSRIVVTVVLLALVLALSLAAIAWAGNDKVGQDLCNPEEGGHHPGDLVTINIGSTTTTTEETTTTTEETTTTTEETTTTTEAPTTTTVTTAPPTTSSTTPIPSDIATGGGGTAGLGTGIYTLIALAGLLGAGLVGSTLRLAVKRR
jgi:hypothetical protein